MKAKREKIEQDYLKLQQLTDLERMRDNMIRHQGALWIMKTNHSTETAIRHAGTRERFLKFIQSEIETLQSELGLIDPYPAPEFEEVDQ